MSLGPARFPIPLFLELLDMVPEISPFTNSDAQRDPQKEALWKSVWDPESNTISKVKWTPMIFVNLGQVLAQVCIENCTF